VPSREPAPKTSTFRARRPLLSGVLLCAAILAATADERLYGLLIDGQIMIRTAVSMATLGEIGIARGQAVAIDRPEGDSVSRYGMGASIVLVLPVLFAPVVARIFGPGATQSLFVLTQILLILGAAATAGSLGRAWGGDVLAARRALLATALSSPLFAYSGSDFSEPLQAALAGAAFAAAAWAVRPGTPPRRALALSAAAGAAAGFALVTKSLLIVLVVFVVGLLVIGEPALRARRVAAGIAGWLPFAGLWLAFEIVRFGRPLASYRGESFNHPLLDGLLRLTVGPNKGLLFYFPLLVLSAVGAFGLAKRSLLPALLGAGFFAFVLGTASAWWAWDGTFGWGPRLLLPAIPLLAAFAALGAAGMRPRVFRTLFGLGVAVNAIGVLQPDVDTMHYLGIVGPKRLSPAEARRYPPFTYDRDPATGGGLLDPQFRVAGEAALSPLRVAPWLLLQRLRGGDVLGRLEVPPWDTNRPGLAVWKRPEEAIPAANLAHLTRPFAWPHVGMSLFREKSDVYWALAWVEGILDQALRAQDMHRGSRAVDFGERLFEILPNPQSAVVLAESYRIAGRREALRAFAKSIEARRPVDPRFGIVLALFARDLGDETAARALVARVVSVDPRPETRRLLEVPVAAWPATLRDVTGENRRPRS
jgi:hypothetical protein